MQPRVHDPHVAHEERSLGELFAELSRETSMLIRKEVELARTEMTQKARTAATHGAMVAAGGALAHAGLLVLLAGIVLGLAQLGVPAWLSAFIVAAAVIAIGYGVAMRGISALRNTNLAPTQTMESLESLKEDTTWTTRTRA
jgi:cytochrome c biogenesis protein ResB